MRMFARAVVFGIGLTAGGVAAAGPWSDPAGRINFTAPNGWQVENSSTANGTTVLTFDGGHDCFLIGRVNPVTANSSPGAVNRTMTQPLAESSWITTANSIRDLFPNNSARLTSQSVDTSGVWPVQRAQFESSRGTVYATLQARPGVDLMAFCSALAGASTAVFDNVFASISHPNDPAWRASLEAAAAPATPPVTPPAQ